MWNTFGTNGRLAWKHCQHYHLRPKCLCSRRSYRFLQSEKGSGRYVPDAWFIPPKSPVFSRGGLRLPVSRVVFVSPRLTRLTFTGRSELRIFFGLYLLTLIFQILTNGSVIQQGSKGLVILTAIHAGLVATLFWSLLGNAIVATQIVEDGTLSSLIVRFLSFPKRSRPLT